MFAQARFLIRTHSPKVSVVTLVNLSFKSRIRLMGSDWETVKHNLKNKMTKIANCALCLHDMTCGLTELLNDLNNHLQPSLVDRKWSINKAKALFVSTDVFRNWCWWVIWDKDHLGQLMWHFFCHLLSVLRQPTPGLYCYPIQHVKNTELILSLAFCFCALPPLVTSACLYQLC